MSQNLLFEISVDAEHTTIHIKKEFDAPLVKLWDAWTIAEIQDKWWAPKPWQSKTKSMKFTEGGHRLYAMVGPEGEEHWGISTYTKIVDHNYYEVQDSFCNENGLINKELPTSTFGVRFTEENNITLVTNFMKFETVEQLNATLEMGFKEGMTAALNNLENVVSFK